MSKTLFKNFKAKGKEWIESRLAPKDGSKQGHSPLPSTPQIEMSIDQKVSTFFYTYPITLSHHHHQINNESEITILSS